jgi:hypothetical protein
MTSSRHGPAVFDRAYRFLLVLSLALLGLLQAGCAPDLEQDRTGLDAQGNLLRPIALFDLAGQERIPWPNAIVQTSFDAEGNLVLGPLNLPNPANDPLIAQVNTLSGFTQLPVITQDFSRPISTGSILPGVNFVIAGINPADSSDIDDMSEAVTYRFDEELGKLIIHPLRPLRPAFQYVVVMTKSIEGVDGRPIEEDVFFNFTKFEQPLYDPATNRILSDLLLLQGIEAESAAQLEQVRQLYQTLIYPNPLLSAIVGGDLARVRGVPPETLSQRQIVEHYAVASAFITASYPGGDPTVQLDQAVRATLASATAGGFQLAATFPASAFFAQNAPHIPHDNLAFIAFGGLTSADFRGEALTWPADTTDLTGSPYGVPIIITYPNAITGGPVPVIMFQHGLGTCALEAVLAVADSFAQAGFAIVGLDIVEHGERAVTNADPTNDDEEPGICDQQDAQGRLIRTGEGFIRLDNMRITQDAIRQTVADQTALAKAVSEGAFAVFQGGGDFVPGSLTFAGLSLGGVVGSIFLAQQDIVNVGVLNATGAWLSRLFIESATVGPRVLQGIADRAGAGPITGATFRGLVLRLTPLVQGLIDQAEPAYYMVSDINGENISENNSILLQEVRGDAVIPNFSTTFMASVANLEFIDETTAQAFPFPAWSRFEPGHHSVLLTPNNPQTEEADQEFLATTVAMRTQLLTYLGSFLQTGGSNIQVVISE